MADVFRVFAYDINTNTQVCEIPAAGLTFDSRLNDAGSCDFTVNLTDPDSAAQLAPLMPYVDSAPFAVYVDRDGVLVWGGWAKTNHYTHSTASAFPIGAKEWPDYFSQRRCVATYDQAAYPTGIDPASLIAIAVGDAQDPTKAGPGGSVGINVVRTPASGSGLPRVVPTYTDQTFVAQVIADQTAGVTPGTGGVDVTTSVAWGPVVNGNRSPKVTLNVTSPRAGRIAGDPVNGSGLIVELLNAVDFDWPNDFGSSATTLLEAGGGSGTVAPEVIVQAPGVAVGGLGQPPRIDKVVQHSTVFDKVMLQRFAYGEAQQFAPPVSTPTVTLRTADGNMPLGSWVMGDDVRLRAPGFERFPGGVDSYWRIVQHTVTVPDEGVPTVKLTLNPPPTY